MAITVANLITSFNRKIGDTSNDRVTAADRLEYATDAVIWLTETLNNDHQLKSFDLEYIDTVNRYSITTGVADLLEGADLRRGDGENAIPFTQRSPKDLKVTMSSGLNRSEWCIERMNGETYLLVVNPHAPTSFMIEDFVTLGDWEADTTGSDATNLSLDTITYTGSQGALRFDVDVSQSVNNYAIVQNENLQRNLEAYEDDGTILMDVFFPELDDITSVSLTWGTSSSAYWTETVSTDIDGEAFKLGWNTLAFEWSEATKVSTPTSDDIQFMSATISYDGTQADATNFKIDRIRIAHTDTLHFLYNGFIVGQSNAGADLLAFTATTDVPYFSGLYDHYKHSVVHKMTSLAFADLRLLNESTIEEALAEKALKKQKQIFPAQKQKPVRTFRPVGVSFRRKI